MDWSDALNVHSIGVIETLQEKLSSWEWWIVRVSVLGDNREAFVFFFPLLAGLSLIYGARLLWAAVIVEWSNLIMKWLIRGDRPFWYVQESPMFNNFTRPALRQFSNTCESGPGTPSGHLMMNVAIFYIFIRAVCNIFVWNNRLFSDGAQKAVAWFLYAVYGVWISLVFISRLYIQAHFIHQCVLGVVAGILIGHYCWHCDALLSLGSVRSVLLASFLFISSGATWMLLVQGGLDPMWSVSKALKYCYDPVYVKIDAQPYFIMARFTGAALGLGLGMSSDVGIVSMNAPGRLLRSLLACKGGLFLGRFATIMLSELPSHDVAKFLTFGLGIHAALPYTIVTTLPFILLKLIPLDDPKKAKKAHSS